MSLLHNSVVNLGTNENSNKTFWWLCTGAFSLHDVCILISLSSALLLILLTEQFLVISILIENTLSGIIPKSAMNVQCYSCCSNHRVTNAPLRIVALSSWKTPLLSGNQCLMRWKWSLRIIKWVVLSCDQILKEISAPMFIWKCLQTSTELPICLIIVTDVIFIATDTV